MAQKATVLNSTKETFIDAGVGLVGGGVIGAAIGKYSLIAGLPVAIFGHFKDNRWAKALGMGMILANGYQSASNSLSGEEDGTDGIDMAAIQEGAKARIGAYFKGFQRKLLLPAKAPVKAANGLGEGETTYFANPYNGIEEYTTMAGSDTDDPAFINGVIGSVGNLQGAAGLSGTGNIW
jgi:hypothetical protein